MAEETWMLMSTDVFDTIRTVGTSRKLMAAAIHATPDEMEVDPNIHRHLNEGGIVVIHCETE